MSQDLDLIINKYITLYTYHNVMFNNTIHLSQCYVETETEV